MAEVILTLVINQLSDLFSQEYARLAGLEQGLRFIGDELESMRAFLKEAEAKDFVENDHELKQWVNQVREAAYDTEDVIDEFLLTFARRGHGGFFGRVLNVYTFIKTLRARRGISTKISNIQGRVEDIYARHQRYKSNQGTCPSIVVEDDMVRDIRGRAILLEEPDLVGIHVPKNEVLLQILDDNSHLKIVSIVGMGGLGKTTLIRRVYEETNVKRQFQSHAWITISQSFNIELILKDLIRQLHDEVKIRVPLWVETKDVDGLKMFLKDLLQEKRYVIVLDDIWSIDAWDALQYALPDCNRGSRVILTTRIAEVAFASCYQYCGYVHQMKALSDEDSWTLFCNKAFQDKHCPLPLEIVSRMILKKCEGLPLAIVSICGLLLLKDKHRVDEWEKVHRSLTSELEGRRKLDRVKKILLLSYNDLPYHLKGCMLYMSLYPEDFKIRSWSLLRQWIAEGFVQAREGISNTEVAQDYFNELVSRSLIQVARSDIMKPTLELCCIHDFVREITLSKAKEHGIVNIIKGRCRRESKNARRLVIHDPVNAVEEDINFKNLRSLMMLRYIDHTSTLSFLKFLCSRVKLLKVLNLDKSPLENIPKAVFKLLHLKYLSMQGSKVKAIPKSIKNLQNLEFLNFSDTKVKELPVEILKLEKLSELHLYQLGGYSNNHVVHGFKAPIKIGRLVSLEYLYFIDANNEETVREIGKLSQLRGLGITKLRREYGKQFCCSVEKLTNLRRLSINEDDHLDLHHHISRVPPFLQLLTLGGHLEQVPKWILSLQSLTELCLFNSGLREDQLERLQVLPNLLLLRLIQAYEGETLCFKAGGFQKLKHLLLVQLKELRLVTIEEGAMPQLKKLEIADCKLMNELPQGIENLNFLQEIVLCDMSIEFVADMEDGHKRSENYLKIAHVPEIFVGNWMDGRWDGHYL